MRELVKDALHGGQTNLAREMADRLVQEPDSTFGDDLLRLDVLGTSRSQEFSEALKAVRTAATNALHATNSLARLHELALWQISRLSPAESLSWARSLPEEVQTNTPIAMITADLLVAARDWTDLAEFLEKQHWAEADTLRLAYRALALRQQGLEAAAQAEWGQAIKGASGSKGGMLMLLRMAADWKWQNEVMEVLSSFVSRYPLEQWAVDLLTQAYLREGQTRPLLALFRQLQPTKPDDLSLKNNLAMTALLLDAQELRPHDLAREVFEAAKTNASFASTYAFSLHLQEKHAEALEIMRQLPANALEDPMIAGYYAMILKANGRSAEAERFFEISSQAKLLPEERRIIDQARGSGG
jgi:hypothetical protein